MSHGTFQKAYPLYMNLNLLWDFKFNFGEFFVKVTFI